MRIQPLYFTTLIPETISTCHAEVTLARSMDEGMLCKLDTFPFLILGSAEDLGFALLD